jgi:hypothetical protein
MIPEAPNAQVRRSLVQYLSFSHAPGFALLLTGPWGVGKTHLISNLERSAQSDIARIVRVSLYGLVTRQEIDQALSVARYPWLTQPRVNERPRHGDPVRAVRADFDRVPAMAPAPDTAAYVFDDLERCAMPIQDTLGYINHFVEREGRKVIVLANEEPLLKKEEAREAYLEAKEKVIGRSFTVKPDFDAAFEAFLARVDDEPARLWMASVRSEIRNLHEQSETNNLRILQQTLWDFERIYRGLSETHREKSEAVEALMRLCFPLSFELKSNGLLRSDLHDRIRGRFGFSAKNPSRFQIAARKYSGSTLHDTILPDDLLEEILVDGWVDEARLQYALDNSSWFVTAEEPAWRTVWYSSERAGEVVQAAVRTLLIQFRSRDFNQTGEVLHVFSQLLKLSRVEASGWSVEETVAECRRYIDELRAAGRLEPPEDGMASFGLSGAYGLGFEGKEAPEFRGLAEYLTEQRVLGERDRYPDQAATLLEILKSDPTAFILQIAPRHGGEAKFARAPVLSSLDPDAFAQALIALDPLQFRQVLLGLANRYDHSALQRELVEEWPWAKALEAALLTRAASLAVFDRTRVAENVTWILGAKLREAEARSGPSSPVDDA